jgi:hypothetical protein
VEKTRGEGEGSERRPPPFAGRASAVDGEGRDEAPLPLSSLRLPRTASVAAAMVVCGASAGAAKPKNEVTVWTPPTKRTTNDEKNSLEERRPLFGGHGLHGLAERVCRVVNN